MPAKPEIDLSEFRRIRKPGCAFANLTVKAEHVDTLRAAMQADDISGDSVQEWLKKRGYAISADSIRRHRRGTCVCLPTN